MSRVHRIVLSGSHPILSMYPFIPSPHRIHPASNTAFCWFPSNGPCLWQGPPRHIRPVAKPASTKPTNQLSIQQLVQSKCTIPPECDQIAPKSCLEVLRAGPAQPPANPALPINLPSSQKVAQSGLDSNIIAPLRIYYNPKTCPLGQDLPNFALPWSTSSDVTILPLLHFARSMKLPNPVR